MNLLSGLNTALASDPEAVEILRTGKASAPTELSLLAGEDKLLPEALFDVDAWGKVAVFSRELLFPGRMIFGGALLEGSSFVVFPKGVLDSIPGSTWEEGFFALGAAWDARGDFCIGLSVVFSFTEVEEEAVRLETEVLLLVEEEDFSRWELDEAAVRDELPDVFLVDVTRFSLASDFDLLLVEAVLDFDVLAGEVPVFDFDLVCVEREADDLPAGADQRSPAGQSSSNKLSNAILQTMGI